MRTLGHFIEVFQDKAINKDCSKHKGTLPVLSGSVAWSEFLSCLKIMLPSKSTADIVLWMAEKHKIIVKIMEFIGFNSKGVSFLPPLLFLFLFLSFSLYLPLSLFLSLPSLSLFLSPSHDPSITNLQTVPFILSVLTSLFVFGNAHNFHGFHQFLVELAVIQVGNGNLTIGQVAIVADVFQQEVLWKQQGLQKMLYRKVPIFSFSFFKLIINIIIIRLCTCIIILQNVLFIIFS